MSLFSCPFDPARDRALVTGAGNGIGRAIALGLVGEGAMLVKELAKTFGRHDIRVNALVPGAIAAGGFVADASLAKHIPLGRIGEANDLVPMALTVLSNKLSGYVTGAAFVVDGGLSLTNWFGAPVLDTLF